MEMEVENIIKRIEVENQLEYKKWLKEIPYIKFKKDWEVQVSPPFGGAVVRFRVRKGKKEISVYLDCYDNLGFFVGKPYWEAYPIEGEVERFLINEIEDLINAIDKELKD